MVLVGVALGGFTLVMARVPEYRAQMQAWLSHQAKLDIQFSSLSAAWRGYGPELRFTQAEVRSADKQHVLALAEQGSVGFDLWQALRTWRFRAARLSLEGTELKVQRLADGQFELVGQADWPTYESDHAFKLDALPVGEIVIRKVRLSFRDLKTGRGPWLLDQVMLDVRRDIVAGRDVLSLQGRASLPASLGQELSFSARGRGSLQTVEQLSWQAEVVATKLNLAGWAQTLPPDSLAPDTGVGSFRFQGIFIGSTPQRVTGRVQFADVKLKLPHWQTPLPAADPLQVRSDDPDVKPIERPIEPAANQILVSPPPMTYKQIDLQFDSARSADGWLTQFKQVRLDTETRPWADGSAHVLLSFSPEQPGLLLRAEGHVDHIVLDNLWPLLAYLPDNAANARLRALNVTGKLEQLAFNYVRDDADAPPRYGVRADIISLGIAPVGKWPGVTGFSGSLEATGARGKLQLSSRNMELAIPRLFRTPLPVDAVSGQLLWTRDADGLHVQAQEIGIQNTNGRAHANMTLDVPANGASPNINLQASGDELDVSAAPRYMPAGVMRRRVLTWLDTALSRGRVQHAEAALTGALRQFPFRNGGGDFLIKAHIDGLTLDYQSGYQPATGLVVDAEFHNQGLLAKATAGEVNGLKILQATGSIDDFRNSEVRIKAGLQGTLDSGLNYVQRSPIGPLIGSLFQQLRGQGKLAADADMFLPLKNMKQYRADIDVNLDQAQISLPDVSESASNVTGRLHIRNDSVTAAAVRGEFLQGKFSTDTRPVTRGLYNIVASGQAQAAGVMRLLKLPVWVQLAGTSNYRFTLPGYAARDAQNVRRLYSVDSDLQGLAVALPEPAGKRADAKRNLHVEAELHDQDTMQLRGSLEGLRALAQLRQVNNRWQFDRAGVRADGISASLPVQAGLRVEGRIDEFTLDDWLKLGNGAGGVNAVSINGVHVQDVLRSANVTVGRFKLYGFVWPELRAILQATDAGWRVDTAGANAAGQVLVPYTFDAGKALVVNMDVLRLQSEDRGNGTDSGRSATLDPRDLPNIQADIHHFLFGEHDFGALQGSAMRTSRGLIVNDLRISGDSFAGTGNGSWLKVSDVAQCSLNLTLESTDVRTTMQQLNYGDFISGKSGKLIARLSWPGGVDADLLGRASGSLELQLTDGQLLGVQPGAGRVLGLLSVAALPRRLGLDFRDLTDKGMAYDTIHADFTVSNGDARTQNLALHGPAAEVGIVGRMGLGSHDYDQTAVVTGDVGNALPVAGTAIGGPVVGAALLLFSKVFKEPLKGVARAYYHIGGTWEDPKVERIESDAAKATLSGNEHAEGTDAGSTP